MPTKFLLGEASPAPGFSSNVSSSPSPTLTKTPCLPVTTACLGLEGLSHVWHNDVSRTGNHDAVNEDYFFFDVSSICGT